MSEINNLVYFLNSTKDVLGFEDSEDFERKIIQDKEFKIKVQKLVYLSKYFGWNNPFIFTLAERGPYSVELKQIYSMPDLFNNIPEKINEIDLTAIKEFIKNKDLLFFEATATILYLFKDKIDKDECITLLHSLKIHISTDIINDAYNSIENSKLNNNFISQDEINIMKTEVNIKIKELTDDFLNFEACTNRITVTGTMDYIRIALRESNLNLKGTYDLLIFIKRYITLIEQLYSRITCDEKFVYMDLDYLEEIFNHFQDFVSEEHHIIKKIDDDDFDDSLFYK